MSSVAIVVIVVLVLLMFLAALVGSAHGRLTGLQNSLRNAYRRVDEQLSRGHETAGALLSGLDPGEEVEAASRARDAAESARTRIAGAPEDAGTIDALGAAERELESALADLSISGDEDLESNRDRLEFALEMYNETAERYTRYRGRFPGSFAARLFGFPEARPVRLSYEEGD